MRDELPVKPVEEYLVNGPVPADQLMDLDFLEVYVEYVVDSRYDIHFMLERISTHGAPEWWEGTVAEFEAEFHKQYHNHSKGDWKWESEATWRAAYEEVRAGRLADISEDAEDEQEDEFLAQGQRRRDQLWAVELLMNMWQEDKVKRGFL